MPTDQERILDAVIEVRESIRAGSYSSTGWHPAFDKLNQLVGVVCEVVNGDDEDSEDVAAAVAAMAEPGSVPLGELVGELHTYATEPTLDAVLEAARRHCYSVTFRFSGDD